MGAEVGYGDSWGSGCRRESVVETRWGVGGQENAKSPLTAANSGMSNDSKLVQILSFQNSSLFLANDPICFPFLLFPFRD